MSKDEKNTKTAKTEGKGKSNLPERPTYKYGVAALAEKLGIEAASVRVALRKKKVEKAEGGVYGWDTKADFDEVLAQLKEKSAPKAEKKAEKKAEPAKAEKKASKKSED